MNIKEKIKCFEKINQRIDELIAFSPRAPLFKGEETLYAGERYFKLIFEKEDRNIEILFSQITEAITILKYRKDNCYYCIHVNLNSKKAETAILWCMRIK